MGKQKARQAVTGSDKGGKRAAGGSLEHLVENNRQSLLILSITKALQGIGEGSYTGEGALGRTMTWRRTNTATV